MRITGVTPQSRLPITVVVEDGLISAIEHGVNNPDIGSEDLYICPGMIDMMVPGYVGANFADPELTEGDIEKVVRAVYAHGTTHIYPLCITAARQDYSGFLSTINRFAENSPLAKSIAGIHVEGPFISSEDGPRGCHVEEHTRNPDIEEFKQWLKVAGSRIAIITVAPELDGALDFIRYARQAGVKVAIGHSDPTPERINDAVLAGVDISTHLGNGAHGLIHRFDNYIFRQLADDRLWAGVICDGYHLPDSNLRIWFRAKGWHRLVMVSDVVPEAGQTPGVYQRSDGSEVRVHPDGRITPNDNSGNLAGAGHLLDRGVAKALTIGDLNLAQCLEMATVGPATYMGLRHLGTLAPGKEASLFLFDRDIGDTLNVRHTVLAGEVVYST